MRHRASSRFTKIKLSAWQRFIPAVVLSIAAASCEAAVTTLVDNGPPTNRVDIVFLGDGYTQSDLDVGSYNQHLEGYLDHMFSGTGYLADPFPRYQDFFNVHRIDVVSNESGADIPSEGVYVDTALDATYETAGIERRLAISSASAFSAHDQALEGTEITADLRMVSVNHTNYGGSGGAWTVFAGGNSSAREIALHELGHSFSNLADEYVSYFEPYGHGEPIEPNVTTDPTGAKWSHWLGFDDPRGSSLDIGVYEGARYYETGIYRPSSDSKMRSLNKAFDAVSREKIILDIYGRVDPFDSWLDNSSPVTDINLWVEVVDPDVIRVDWYVDELLVDVAAGEVFNISRYGLGVGTYTVRAHAYDELVDFAYQGGFLDLVRKDLDALQQDVSWTLTVRDPISGDFDGNDMVNEDDLEIWKAGFGMLAGASSEHGDGDRDHDADGDDFLIWQRTFDHPMVNLGVTVPEPPSLLLMVGLAAFLVVRGTVLNS